MCTQGESYAGRYVPYIGAQMLDQNNTEYFDLKGAIVYDPCIGDCGLVQMEYPIAAFASANNELLNLDQATINKLNQMSDECGYTDVSLHSRQWQGLPCTHWAH